MKGVVIKRFLFGMVVSIVVVKGGLQMIGSGVVVGMVVVGSSFICFYQFKDLMILLILESLSLSVFI